MDETNIVLIVGEGSSASHFARDLLNAQQYPILCNVPDVLDAVPLVRTTADIKTKYYSSEVEFWMVDTELVTSLSPDARKAFDHVQSAVSIVGPDYKITNDQQEEDLLNRLKSITALVSQDATLLCLCQSPSLRACTRWETLVERCLSEANCELVSSSPLERLTPLQLCTHPIGAEEGPQRLAEALQCTQWRSLQCTSPSSIRPTAPATVDYDGDKSSHDEHNDDRADNHEERPTEGNGGREEHGEESAPSTSVDFGFNLDEGFERTCEKIQELRNTAQSLPDEDRKELAASVALQFAAMLGLDEDELKFPADMDPRR